MNNEITTVEFNVNRDIEQMTPEQLIPEINALYHQMEAVGNIAMLMMAETGRMLIAVKNKVRHGEFESWCEQHLDFSKSKAEKMMQLAERAGDETSIFSKTETFTDLGISKVMALLAVPEDIAVEVIKSGDAEEKSVRELKAELKELKDKHDKEISDLQLQLEETKSSTVSTEDLEEIKKKLEKEKEKNKTLKDKQAAAIDAAVAKANEEAEKKIDTEVKKASKEMAESFKELQAENEKLTKQLDRSGNEELVEFRIQTKAMQECFNACIEIIDRVSVDEEETAKKMREGMKRILEAKIAELE